MDVWMKSIPYRKEMVTFALERGVSTFWVSPEDVGEIRKLGRLRVVGDGGDLDPRKDLEVCSVMNEGDLNRLYKLPDERKVYVEKFDWAVIPLENLVALGKSIYVSVRNLDELRVYTGVLEKGVKGIVLEVSSIKELDPLIRALKEESLSVDLTRAVISEIKPLGLGDRVCVDTCSLLSGPKGMLVGNSSSGFFLVSAENVPSEYVNERPFRVNAGAVHMYTLLPSGKTAYLSEVEAGTEIMILGHDGHGEVAWVGRSKIERRPLLLIRGDVGGTEVSAVLQNAETIRLIAPDGRQVSVSELERGVEVLCYTEKGGRHFGTKIEETIQEK